MTPDEVSSSVSGNENFRDKSSDELSFLDDLTGLLNRRAFRKSIEEFKSQAHPGEFSLALLYMDIDHLKQVNDTLGHSTGDLILVRVGKLLTQEIGNTGKIFRYSGDEFLAVLPNLREDEVRVLSGRLLEKIETSFKKKNEPHVTLSIGYAIYPEHGSSISHLMELSVRALQFSKLEGRNRFSSCAEAKVNATWPVRIQSNQIVGRDKELDLLEAYLEDCREGRSRLLFVTGEAGIGKSRLLSEFLRTKRKEEYHFLVGECKETGQVQPYAAVREALQNGYEAKDAATMDVYRGLKETYRQQLLNLVPQFERLEKKKMTPYMSADKQLLMESMLTLLRNLSLKLPTVLILEDLHWSDRATLGFLQYLARALHDERILVAATFRDEEASGPLIPWFIKSMSRDKLFQTLQLQRLSQKETGKMVADVFYGFHVKDSVQQSVLAETDGNPFYVEELLKLLMQEGSIQKNENKELELVSGEKVPVPFSIKTLILRRVGGLGDPLKRILNFAAILGDEFELGILKQLMEDNEGYLLEMIQHLVEVQMICEIPSISGERFGFNHQKIRSVIYDEMGNIKRKKLHQRVAEVLENAFPSHPGYREEMVYHFAKAGNIEKSRQYFQPN